MIYLYILLLLILILSFIPLKIQLYYEFKDISKYKTKVSYFFGFFTKEIDSASENIKKDNNKNNKFKIDLLYYIQYFIDKGNIKKLYFRMNIGFEDPSILGISIGFIWSIINILFGYYLRNNDIDKIRDKEIQVIPLFNHNVFEIYFLCIIKVNLVYIITAYIRIIKKRKGGDSIARTSNRRINENYNE